MKPADLIVFWRDACDRIDLTMPPRSIGQTDPRFGGAFNEWPLVEWSWRDPLAYRSVDDGTWFTAAPRQLLPAAMDTWKCRRRERGIAIAKIEWHAEAVVLVRTDDLNKDILRYPVRPDPALRHVDWRDPATPVSRAALEILRHQVRLLLSEAVPETGGDLLRACEFLRERLHHADCDRHLLAQWLGCHPNHCSRLFRRHCGLSLGDWLQRERLRRACCLLAGSEHSVAEIAQLCGLGSATWFIRCFRRTLGTTPARWRALPPEERPQPPGTLRHERWQRDPRLSI